MQTRSVSRAALPSVASAGNEQLATDAAVRVVAGEVAPHQLTTEETTRFRADREAQKSIKNFTLNFGPQHPAGTCVVGGHGAGAGAGGPCVSSMTAEHSCLQGGL